MPAPLPKPARRVTLYLFEADCQQFERRYGRGWTEQVRLLVEKNCRDWQRAHDEIDAILGSNQVGPIADDDGDLT